MERGLMGDHSATKWTDATWNPTTGCTKVSTGCDRCYAERIALRFGRSFDPQLHPDRLEKPLTWRGPRRMFPGDSLTRSSASWKRLSIRPYCL